MASRLFRVPWEGKILLPSKLVVYTNNASFLESGHKTILKKIRILSAKGEEGGLWEEGRQLKVVATPADVLMSSREGSICPFSFFLFFFCGTGV
jgi:hypothetical protein